MATELSQFDRLMADVAAGSEEAVWQLAETYTPYIIRAVRRSLSSRLRPKLDSQDFAQTLWASLLLRPEDLTRLKTSEQLIAYLAQAARNKVLEKTRHYKAQKCDIYREETLVEATPQTKVPASKQGLYSREPTPSTAASVRERWRKVFSNASARDQEIVRLRLKKCSFEVIGSTLQIDERTARRAVQQLMEQFLE